MAGANRSSGAFLSLPPPRPHVQRITDKHDHPDTKLSVPSAATPAELRLCPASDLPDRRHVGPTADVDRATARSSRASTGDKACRIGTAGKGGTRHRRSKGESRAVAAAHLKFPLMKMMMLRKSRLDQLELESRAVTHTQRLQGLENDGDVRRWLTWLAPLRRVPRSIRSTRTQLPQKRVPKP